MTKDEWEMLRKAIEIYPNRGKLSIDGYTVDLMLQSTDPYHKEIVVFVNGICKTEWALGKTPEGEEIRRRFFCSSTKSLVKKPKEKLTKKEQALYEECKKKYSVTTYLPFWKSFERLKRHLIKNNENIEIMEVKENGYD